MRLVFAASLAVAGLAAAAFYAVKGKSSRAFGASVYRGRGGRRSVALTFDDGPTPGTLDLLKYLEQQGVRATFFQCGANVQRHPEIARAVHAGGHEIGNHTYSHMRLPPRLGRQPQLHSAGEIFQEFARTQQTIEQATGVRCTLLRAPYGMRWFGLRAVQRELKLLGVMWTVIGRDWELSAEKIAARVLGRVRPGAIVCLHDGRDVRPDPDVGETIAAVKEIVPALKKRGFTFETVSELIRP